MFDVAELRVRFALFSCFFNRLGRTVTEDSKIDRPVTVHGGNIDQFTVRIRNVIGDESVRSFAKRAGLGTSTLQNIVEGARPTVDKLVAIAHAGAVSIDWLATGQGPRDRTTAESGYDTRPLTAGRGVAEDPSPYFDVTAPGSGFVLVPRIDVKASAGHGNWAAEENLIDHMAFRADFVRRTLRADPRNLVLITAIGDSMEPTIRAGDLLLVDRGVDRIIDDAIYVLARDGEVVVKRVQQFFGGAIVVKSDHVAAYAEQTLSPDQAEQLVVAGRVRWIGRLI